MVVAFTPNIGLAKPDESELASNWVNGSELVEDNNNIIIDEMDIVLTTYTPTFIGPTTNPNVGAGHIRGEYCKVNGYIFGTFVIRCTTPGVAAGTGAGAYGISLPELADAVFHTVGTTLADTPGTASCIGEGYMTDSDSIPNSGTLALDLVHVGGVAYMRPITEAYAGKTVRWFGPTLPFTLATDDNLAGSFFYKAAT
jgi:hypothetical protein